LISFRYHIVSVTAVFLALGLGIVLGSAVRPTEVATKNSINRLTSQLNDARAAISDLRNQVQSSSSVVKNLSTRAIRGALAGRQVLYVDDGAESSWEGGLRKAMSDATAQEVGTVTLTGKWTDPEAAADLGAIAAAAGVKVGADGAGPAVMAALGGGLGKPNGAQLAAALTKGGYVRTDAKTPGLAPLGAGVVTFSSGPATNPQVVALAAFALGAAKAAPVLVVAGASDDLGAVGVVRGDGGLPRLATFDSGSSDATGVGAVLAMASAIDGHGGNFGSAPGLPYLPPG
jgi:hypothetical protein